jgi:outer membrane protein assembly factor BamB
LRASVPLIVAVGVQTLALDAAHARRVPEALATEAKTEFGIVPIAGGSTDYGLGGGFLTNLAALDPATGAPRWVFHPDGFVLASLLAVGDVVVAQANHLADHTGRIYVLDQASGTVAFQLSTPGPLYAQATYAEGKLLVSDASGIVYAFSAPGP